MLFKRTLIATTAMLSVASIASVANAAEANAAANTSGTGIAEVIVTAQKRAENVQNVPIAISAFTAEAMRERGVSSVAALSNVAPNVTLDAGTPFSGSSFVLSAYIRGIGANDFAFNIDPGVGIYLDGVYLARSVGANQDLMDVERVEVLKGPQGTLFGRNTIGGAISIVTHDPGKEFGGRMDVTTGSDRLIQARGTIDIPIMDSLTSSLSFSMKQRDGYMHRIPYPGASNYAEDPITAFKAAGYNNAGLGTEGGDNNWSLRGKLKWDNGGKLTVRLSGDYTRVDQSQIANKLITTFPGVFAGTYNCAIAGIAGGAQCGGGPPPFAYVDARGGLTSITDLPSIFGVNAGANPAAFRLPYDNRFVTNNIDTSYANGNNFSKLTNYGFGGDVNYDLNPNITLKSITAYRVMHWQTGMDLDGSPLDFLHTSFSMNQKQFSQEVQIIGNAFDKKLNFVLGGYYFKESGDLHDYVTFAEGLLQVDGPNNLSTQNYAFFGQADYKLNNFISFTAGGRYTHEDKTFEGFQSDNNGLTYKILNFLAGIGAGPPACASITPISDACRIAAGFPNPGQPLRYYIAGVQQKTFDNFSPKLGIQLHPTEDVMVYGSWSRGYKTGGWTTRLSNPLPPGPCPNDPTKLTCVPAPGFGPEKAETFEVGVKSQFLEHKVQLNAAAFITNYDGIQLNFQQGVSPTIQNAGNARIKGFEVEGILAPTRAFTINASVGYLEAVYTSVDAPARVAPSALQTGVFVGATLPKTPHWKSDIGPRYEYRMANGGSLVALADWVHTTSMKNDTEGTFLLIRPNTDQINASVEYRAPSDRWNLTVGGINITNTRFLTTGQAQLAGGQIYGTYNHPAEWYAGVGFIFLAKAGRGPWPRPGPFT